MNARLSTYANYSVATDCFALVYISYLEFWVLNSQFCYLEIRILNSEFWILTTVDSNSESWLVSRSCSCDQNFIIHHRCLEFAFCDCCRRSDRNDHCHKIIPFIRAGFFSTGNDVTPIITTFILRNSEPCSGLVK